MKNLGDECDTDSLKHYSFTLGSCAVADDIEICRVGRFHLIKTVLEDQCDPVSLFLPVCHGLLLFCFMSHTFLSSKDLLCCDLSEEIEAHEIRYFLLAVTNTIDLFSVFLH